MAQTSLWDWLVARNPAAPAPRPPRPASAPAPAPPRAPVADPTPAPPAASRPAAPTIATTAAPVPADPAAIGRLAAELARTLAAAGHRVELRIQRNRRMVLTLRGGPGCWRLGVHADLLADPDVTGALPEWLARRGRGLPPAIRRAIDRWNLSQAELPDPAAADLPPMPTLGDERPDLDAWLDRIHRAWFADLPRPRIRWSKGGDRRQRHIRYGSYWRQDGGEIRLHPRLAQPWIARCFIEHVIYHELCHHRQACAPLRREPPHSQRFRAWERAFPEHDAAMRWEAAHRRRLLSGDGAEPQEGPHAAS